MTVQPESVEHEFFIQCAVIVFRHAPFLVVIRHVKRIVLGRRSALDRRRDKRRAHAVPLAGPIFLGQANRAHGGLRGDRYATRHDRRIARLRVGNVIEPQHREPLGLRLNP